MRLRVRLTANAGARLAHFTAEASGATRVVMTFDDETLVEATLIAEMLRSGAPSFRPGRITVDPAADPWRRRSVAKPR